MKTSRPQRRGFTLVELLVVIAILAALAAFATPQLLRQKKKGDMIQAVNNVRQIGLAMTDFETEYGSYPDSSTAETVRQNTETELEFGGNTSNDYFRQLVATEITQAEGIFYAKTAYTKKPDDVMNTSDTAIGKGECAFGYIMNGDKGFSSAGNPGRPILATPLAFPFNEAQFDSDYFDGKTVVWKVDNSATQLNILKSTKQAQLGGGKRLLQTGDGTVWGGEGVVNPVMIHPQPK